MPIIRLIRRKGAAWPQRRAKPSSKSLPDLRRGGGCIDTGARRYAQSSDIVLVPKSRGAGKRTGEGARKVDI